MTNKPSKMDKGNGGKTSQKRRRLGASKHRFVEVVPREIGDAAIEADFENSKLFPDEEL